MELINLEEFKTYKKVSSSDSDNTILQIITNVSEFVKTYCNRTFVDYYTTDTVEYFDGTSRNFVLPSESPIVYITTVEKSEDGGETYEELVSGTDYFWDRRLDKLTTGTNYNFVSSYYPAANSLKVTYKGGYSETPADIKIACFDLVEYYKEGEYTPKRVMSGATQDNAQFRLMFTSNLPPHIKRVLDMHRFVV